MAESDVQSFEESVDSLKMPKKGELCGVVPPLGPAMIFPSQAQSGY
jgi:hypothetical protein